MPVARHPDESPAYAKLRDELQQAEVELRDQRERVAALRRRLPRDHAIADATLEEIRDGQRVGVTLSELFEDPAKPLLLMHFMYGKAQTAPCPMCTAWADGYDGALPHIQQTANFAVLVAGDVATFSAYARHRGWRNLRLVGARDSDLKRTLGVETDDGARIPASPSSSDSPTAASPTSTPSPPSSARPASAAWTCSRRSGTSSTSPPRAAATSSRRSRTRRARASAVQRSPPAPPSAGIVAAVR
jgi:predicted dithiol-disulfide oxidoreductase (DUF899 family)